MEGGWQTSACSLRMRMGKKGKKEREGREGGNGLIIYYSRRLAGESVTRKPLAES